MFLLLTLNTGIQLDISRNFIPKNFVKYYKDSVSCKSAREISSVYYIILVDWHLAIDKLRVKPIFEENTLLT